MLCWNSIITCFASFSSNAFLHLLIYLFLSLYIVEIKFLMIVPFSKSLVSKVNKFQDEAVGNLV